MVQALALTQCFSCQFYVGKVRSFEDLAIFGYRLNMKVFFLKSFYNFGNLLEPCIKVLHFYLKFWSN
jgi:hypothetical protein